MTEEKKAVKAEKTDRRPVKTQAGKPVMTAVPSASAAVPVADEKAALKAQKAKLAKEKEQAILQNRKGVKESNENLPESLQVVVPTRSGFGTKRRRPNLRNFDLQDTIYVDYEDKLKEKISPRDEALRRLRNGMDPSAQTIFKGTVVGMNTYVNPQTKESKTCAIVNTTAGIDGFAGKLVRIFYDDFFIPMGSKGSILKEPKSYINAHIGAEVEFVVYNIIENSESGQTILGSRKRAAEKKAAKYWFGKRDGEFLLSEGKTAEGRIISVDQYGLITELFGIEFFVPARHLSYSNLKDCRTKFAPGKKLPFRIMSIDRGKTITAELSYKATFEDTRIAYMKDYHVGDKIQCKVKEVIDYSEKHESVIIFVTVEDKFDILCHMKDAVEVLPVAGETVKLIIHGISLPPESEEPKIWGEIFHVNYM